MSTAPSSFPGGASVTLLDVYRDEAIDGICGGSPHVHLVSTECYVVVSGTGALHTIAADGYRETPLAPGDVVWFTPGTIHRAVNHGDLRAVVVMSNAGLPEAGDAVMTFPPQVVADAAAYAEASALGDSLDEDIRSERARRRRNLAVEGFRLLSDAARKGDFGPLHDFYASAATIVAERSAAWPEIIRTRPLQQANASLAAAEAIANGDTSHLIAAAVHQARSPVESPAFGMCGRLRTYDVSDPQVER